MCTNQSESRKRPVLLTQWAVEVQMRSGLLAQPNSSEAGPDRQRGTRRLTAPSHPPSADALRVQLIVPSWF
ncbi:hypothetical protein Poly59_37120 [Rubripirellula reticaptiva]|uniref:Uncharacterized protein n=1 Tax=Rubripirellula reticaptiva TaxID=2528013 RepID=A0A5C6EP06_9BACT|nr:hypothetical protein Poly59_37120 [Rubripirellula reticaptiva]